MKVGDVFTKDNLKIVRPGFGLPPKYYEKLIGNKVSKDINKGSAVRWDILTGLVDYDA